jgi:hypothetical protein
MEEDNPRIGIARREEGGSRGSPCCFALELAGAGGGEGLIFAAGISSPVEGGEGREARTYSLTLLEEFFRRKGPFIRVPDYGRSLRRIFAHLHRNLREKRGGAPLDLVLAVADGGRIYAVRAGGGKVFVYDGEKALPLFGETSPPLLGEGDAVEADVESASLRPGDFVVLCDPAMGGVMGPRDIAVILERAAAARKAALFLSAIAERKGAKRDTAGVVWEVPNLKEVDLLSGEHPPGGDADEGPGMEEGPPPGEEGEIRAEHAKRRWLSLWRRRKE